MVMYPRQGAAHEPLYEVNPLTGISIEVFYSDRALETFGRAGAGWFWWPRRRGCSPDGVPSGIRTHRTVDPHRGEFERATRLLRKHWHCWAIGALLSAR